MYIPRFVLASVAGAASLVTLAPLRKRLRAVKTTTVVVCPKEQLPARVELASNNRIESCSRRPQLETCSEACSPQIQFSPEQCSQFVANYEGKNCISCGVGLTAEDWYRSRVGSEQSRNVLASPAGERNNGQPVCFSCWVRGFRAASSA